MFHIVVFDADDPRSKDDWLHYEGSRLIQQFTSSLVGRDIRGQRFEYALVLGLFGSLRTAEQRQYNAIMAKQHGLESYLRWGAVYFINHTALRMFRDGGLELPAIDEISDEDMPPTMGSRLRGPYRPTDEEERPMASGTTPN
jgi:hypothetical protein